MSRYRFSIRHSDDRIQRIQREIEDNFAPASDLETKESKVSGYTTVEPTLKEMKDGEKVYYYDGTNLFEYRRVGGKLFKSQSYTEV